MIAPFNVRDFGAKEAFRATLEAAREKNRQSSGDT